MYGLESSTGFTSTCKLAICQPAHTWNPVPASVQHCAPGLINPGSRQGLLAKKHCWANTSPLFPFGAWLAPGQTRAWAETAHANCKSTQLQYIRCFSNNFAMWWVFDYKQDFLTRTNWKLVLQTSFIILDWRFYHLRHLRLEEGRKSQRLTKVIPPCPWVTSLTQLGGTGAIWQQ